jgi:hypothetical protein
MDVVAKSLNYKSNSELRSHLPKFVSRNAFSQKEKFDS